MWIDRLLVIVVAEHFDERGTQAARFLGLAAQLAQPLPQTRKWAFVLCGRVALISHAAPRGARIRANDKDR